MSATLTVCPSCWTSRSLDGTCECDVDGVAPAASTATVTADPAGTLTGDLLELVRRATRLGWINYDEALDRTRRVMGCQVVPVAQVFCDVCAHDLARLLALVPNVLAELATTRVGARGVDYRSLGGGTGGAKSLPLPIHQGAIDAHDRVGATLAEIVDTCRRRNFGAHLTPPARRDVLGMAAWLRPLVHDMKRAPGFAAAGYDVADAIEAALHVVDRPATRQDLGPHEGCGGRLSAVQGAACARCSECGDKVPAQLLRDDALDQLDERLCTAAEIARLSTYLGLNADREQVRKRVTAWHGRGRLHQVPHTLGAAARFRWSDVEPLLATLPSITDALPIRPIEET